RAIPHGLGITPKVVLIGTDIGRLDYDEIEPDIISYHVGATIAVNAVTSRTSTNFYVGNVADYTQSANATGINYHWVAFG
ncbi:hypothetical protein LCGC14_3124320, partial [marine sediment metagenome]